MNQRAGDGRMTVGENIKRLRENQGLKQSELARLIGVSRATMSQYEADIICPRMGNVERLAAALGCLKSDIVEDVSYTITTLDNLSPDERELLTAYRELTSTNKAAVLQLAKTLSRIVPLFQ